MIRRSVWLGLGAVLGIASYRRAERLVRSVTPAAVPAPQRAGLPGPAAGRIAPVQSAAGQYTAAQSAAGRIAARLAIRSARAIGAGTASFARDVRAGMTEYLDSSGEYINRHAGRLGNTLVGQRARGVRADPVQTTLRMAVDGVGRDRTPFP
jgi:hypothetical protein